MMRRLAVYTVALVLFVVGATGVDAAPAQTARSDDGVLATATVHDAVFPDGTTRWLSVTLAIPRGGVHSTEPISSVDMGRPWALFTETVVSDPARNNSTSGSVVCNQVTNPGRYDAGSLNARGNAWDGTTVDVRCEDGSGYAFYRVQWKPARDWPLVTNQVTTAWMGNQVTKWSAANAQGSIEMWPTAQQQSVVSICGVRSSPADDGPDSRCFEGAGQVIPSTNGMTVHAAAV